MSLYEMYTRRLALERVRIASIALGEEEARAGIEQQMDNVDKIFRNLFDVSSDAPCDEGTENAKCADCPLRDFCERPECAEQADDHGQKH